jgi:hypothetical protein
MPPTVVVNMMTAVHAGSIGQSIAFPDVCKTPAPPAPPIPIPYPNIAMSSDAADEASNVKFDGSKLMVKGSNLRMSTGDEAGAAQGLVSNKIKGKAEFVNYSFDVKADGKNVCRLTDPMTQNMGSPANAFGPAELQAPSVVTGLQKQSCEKVNEKKQQQGDDPATNWGKSGVIARDQKAFTKVAKNFGVIIYIRATNPDCTRWIRKKHRPKPHEVIDGKTVDAEKVALVVHWHANARIRINEGRMVSDEAKDIMKRCTKNRKKLGPGSWDYSFFRGIVMWYKEGDADHGMPLRARDDKYGGLKSEVDVDYKDTWITGDYDLMDIMFRDNGCVRPDQNAASFAQIKKELNTGMTWDGIQHGPQAQWVAKKSHGDFSDFSVEEKLTTWLRSKKPDPPKLQIAASRSMPACDKNLTVVYPGGVVHLAENQDVKDAMLCMGCNKPAPKREEEKKGA